MVFRRHWSARLAAASSSKVAPDWSPRIISPAALHPIIDLFRLELPELSDAMGRQPTAVDPTVNRILGNAEILCYFLSGKPS